MTHRDCHLIEIVVPAHNEAAILDANIERLLDAASGFGFSWAITIVDSDTCTLTFNTTGLQTDATTSQDYPIGSVTFTLVGPDATVTATFTMDSTVEATLVVDTVPGVFTINLSTRSVTHSR